MKLIYWKCTCGVTHDHVDRWSQHQSQNRCRSGTFLALGRDETISAVREFHRAGEQPHDLDLGWPDDGSPVDLMDRWGVSDAFEVAMRHLEDVDGRIGLRLRLLVEELAELVDSVCLRDMPNTLKEAADLQYVLDGLLIEIGADRLKTPVFRAVHKSNMSKYDGETVRSPEGKILKGENYQPPDIRAMIGDTTDD